MGELVEFPFGARRAPAAAARLTADLVGADEAKALTVDGSICATYIELLDDLLLRHEGLGTAIAGQYGDTPSIWIADARKLRAEIARRPANIRMAVGIAERAGRLAGLVAALEHERAKDIDQPDGLMAEARSVNEDLKRRLIPTEPHRAAMRPPSVSLAEAHGVRVTEPLAPRSILVRRNAAWMEACSVVFHLVNAARSALGIARALFRIPDDLLVHRVHPSDFATLGGARRRVIRNEAAQFRPHPDHRPTDGSAA